VSASREKKSRQGTNEVELTERELRRQEEEQADRRSMRLYAVVGILVVIMAVAAVVLNSGMLQKNATAVTINGTKYTPADVQYYFNSTLSSTFGLTPGSMDLKATILDEETNQTAYDYVMDLTLNTMSTTAAMCDKAKAEGVTLSQASKDSVKAFLDEIDSSWAATGYPDRATFIRANFGPYMTYSRLGELLERDALATEYINSAITALEYTDSDYDTYYQANADMLDTFTYSQFLFQASVPTKDAEGNDIEMTDDEKAAALAEASELQSDLAESLQIRLDADEDAAALAEEYADSLYSSDISTSKVGSSVSSTYSEWLTDPARKAGDTTIAEYESSTVHNYYVIRYEGRELVKAPSNDVRHILVEDEATAKALLEEYKAGAATEDAFSALAAEHSTDTGSAANGGLITGVAADGSYVENFQNWAVDPARKAGDTGIVDSDFGWHIMYYVGEGDPIWKLTADNGLRNDAYSALIEEASQGYEAVQESGMKYVEG